MTQDLHNLAGAYALHALPLEEAQTFEEHLEHCAECNAELAEFRATAARLGDAVAIDPPGSMKSAVLAQITMTRQERPTVVSITSPVASRLRRFALPAAAAIAVIAIGLGFAIGSLSGRLDDLHLREQTLAAVLASADLTIVHGSGNGANASLVASADLGQAVVTFTDLASAPSGHVYELWMITADGPTPAGLFNTTADGRAMSIMTGDLLATHTIAVTIEPAGGSAAPTTVPFLALSLTA